jgi:gliding motility-associated-like protein
MFKPFLAVLFFVLAMGFASVSLSQSVTITTPSGLVCSGDEVVFTAAVEDCDDAITYLWFVNDNLAQDTANFNQFTTGFTQASSVYVGILCGDGSSDTIFSNILDVEVETAVANAGSNKFIIPGESVELQRASNGSFFWSPPDHLSSISVLNPIASPPATTAYTLTTITANGCEASDNVIVFVAPPITVPNTFSPNGDNINDTWVIQRIHLYPACKVTVYDRWGQRVFNTVGYNQEKQWDGTSRGLKLQSGTYFYVIDLNTGNKDIDIHTGSVTIVY